MRRFSKPVIAFLAVAGLLLSACGEGNNRLDLAAGEAEITTTTTEPEGLSDADIDRLVDEAFGRQGFAPDEVVTGDDVVYDDVPEERGSASFSDVTLKTRQDVANFLGGDSPQSVAARERVQTALADKPGEMERAMSGEGYVPIQFKVAVQYFGTTYFNGSDVVVAGDPRQTAEDDILWLFITREGLILSKASIRADCANPEFERIIPVRPDTPPAPGIEEPPPEQEEPPPTTVPPPEEGGKDHRRSPVSSDPNDPDERIRPRIPVNPPVVIRPPNAPPPPPPPPSTVPTPPEVQAPEPIDPGVPEQPPTTDAPEEVCPTGPDGIPDDSC